MKTHFKFITLFVCLLFCYFGYGQDKIIDSLERRITALEHKVAFEQISNEFSHLKYDLENNYNDWRFIVLSNDREGLNTFYSMSSEYIDAIEYNYSSLKRLYHTLDTKYNFTYEEIDVIDSKKNIINISFDRLKAIAKEHSKR